MFARTLRPASRVLRTPVRAPAPARSFACTPVAHAAAAPRLPQPPCNGEYGGSNEGARQVLFLFGSIVAFAGALTAVVEIRAKHVAPSPPKEEAEEEEAEEEAVEEVVEEAVEQPSGGGAALNVIESAAATVDGELAALVDAAEAALARAPGSASDSSTDAAAAAAALPDPSEAASQGAFNEETGEINWDCPCLGGMAHGPCGEEFKAAFSCFVYSEEEPKGIDCVEKFKGMQECFRAHPDVYAEEIDDDDEAQAEAAKADEAQKE